MANMGKVPEEFLNISVRLFPAHPYTPAVESIQQKLPAALGSAGRSRRLRQYRRPNKLEQGEFGV